MAEQEDPEQCDDERFPTAAEMLRELTHGHFGEPRISTDVTATEGRLYDKLVAEPEILAHVLLVGTHVLAGYDERFDLMAIDFSGRLNAIIIEEGQVTQRTIDRMVVQWGWLTFSWADDIPKWHDRHWFDISFEDAAIDLFGWVPPLGWGPPLCTIVAESADEAAIAELQRLDRKGIPIDLVTFSGQNDAPVDAHHGSRRVRDDERTSRNQMRAWKRLKGVRDSERYPYQEAHERAMAALPR